MNCNCVVRVAIQQLIICGYERLKSLCVQIQFKTHTMRRLIKSILPIYANKKSDAIFQYIVKLGKQYEHSVFLSFYTAYEHTTNDICQLDHYQNSNFVMPFVMMHSSSIQKGIKIIVCLYFCVSRFYACFVMAIKSHMFK